jgi:hypothetical protein
VNVALVECGRERFDDAADAKNRQQSDCASSLKRPTNAYPA